MFLHVDGLTFWMSGSHFLVVVEIAQLAAAIEEKAAVQMLIT